MKKLLITIMTCLMLVGGFTPVLANETPPTGYVYGEEVTGSVKADEVSDTITSFTVDKDQWYVLDIDTSKVSVEVSIYDADHNYINGTTTDYDAKSEEGGAALVFDLKAGSYSIEVKGIEGEGTFTYTLDKQEVGVTPENIIEGGGFTEKETTEKPTFVGPNNFAIDDEGVAKKVKNTKGIKKTTPSKFASEISEYLYYMHVGEEMELLYGLTDAQTILYSQFESLDTEIADVSFNGEVHAKKAGYVNIQFTYNGSVETIEIFVSHVLLITSDGYFMEDFYVYGDKFYVTLYGSGSGQTTYTSTNTSIATVNSAGQVTTKKPGTVYIIAKRGAYADMVKIDVRKPFFLLSSMNFLVSESFPVSLLLWNGPGKISSWKSSKPSVAKVDSKGKVTALKPGTTTISVKNGPYTVKCKVVVHPNSVSYTVDMDVSHYSTAYPVLIPKKLYYSGTTFKMDIYVFNNMSKKVKSLNITIELWYENYYDPYGDYEYVIGRQKFGTINLNLASKKYKKITVSFSKGTKTRGVDLYDVSDYLKWDYWGSYK